MKRNLLAAMLMAGALTGCWTAASAQGSSSSETRKLVESYQLKDNMGAVQKDRTVNFYDVQGVLQRTVQYQETNGENNMNYRTRLAYDDAGRLVKKIVEKAQATSAENVYKEYEFVPNDSVAYAYDDNGYLASEEAYLYRKAQGTRAAYWGASKKYTYVNNAAGQCTEKKEFSGMGMNSNFATNPVNTTTFTYDAQGRKLTAHNDGSYASNKWETAFTYNDNGDILSEYTTRWEPTDSDPVVFDNSKDYTYDGTFLTETVTKKRGYNSATKQYDLVNNTLRTVYSMVDGNPNKIYHAAYDWDKTNNDWNATPKANSETTDVYQDFVPAKVENYGSQIQAFLTDGTSDEINVMCYVPYQMGQDLQNKVTLYRDSAPIFTQTLAEMGEKYNAENQACLITIPRNPQGLHEFFAQNTEVGADGTQTSWNISNTISFNFSVALPAVTDFKVDGVTKNVRHIDETTQDDVTVPAHDDISYTLTVSWLNPATSELTDLGFKRHEVFVDKKTLSYAAVTEAQLASDGDRQVVNITGLDNPTGTVYVSSFFEQGDVSTPVLPWECIEEVKEPVYMYGFITGAVYPAVAKTDLNDPASYEKIWDLDTEDGKDTEVEEFTIGTGVGDAYYGYYSDADYNTQLAAFNFQDKTVTKVGKAAVYGSDFYNVTGMTYDDVNDVVYVASKVVEGEGTDVTESNSLFTLVPNKGEYTKVGALATNYSIIGAMGGKLYGMYFDSDARVWKLDDINTADCSATPITLTDAPACAISYYKTLTGHDSKLYFSMGTYIYTIDPATGAVTKLDDLKKAITGGTFTLSTVTPDIEQPQPESNADTRVLVKTTTFGDWMGQIPEDKPATEELYFYNSDSKLSRVVENELGSGKAVLSYYTENEYNEAGNIVSSDKMQEGTDGYGFRTLNSIASTAYTYNEAGQLTKEDKDGDYIEYTYITDPEEDGGAMGAILTKTYGNAEGAYQRENYVYADEADSEPMVIRSENISAAHPEWNDAYNYVDYYQRNAAGQLESVTRYNDMMMSKTLSRTEYTYFPGTSIVNIITKYDIDETTSEPVPASRKTYTAQDGDTDKLMLTEESYMDGTWYKEGLPVLYQYADYSTVAGMDAVNMTLAESAEAANTPVVEFPLPAYAMANNVDFQVYRNGDLLGTYTMADLGEKATQDADGNYIIHIATPQIPNGDYDFFVAPRLVKGDEMGDNVEYMQLPISNATTLKLATVLPGVSDLHVVDQRTEKQGEEEHCFATIAWTNPADMDKYGFQSNGLIVSPFKVALTTVEDNEVNQGEVDMYPAAPGEKVEITVITRYNLGYVLSEPLTLEVTSIEAAAAIEGLNLRVAGTVATTSQAADIAVFDMEGRQIASAQGATRLDLSGLRGAYIVVARNATAKAAVKAAL